MTIVTFSLPKGLARLRELNYLNMEYNYFTLNARSCCEDDPKIQYPNRRPSLVLYWRFHSLKTSKVSSSSSMSSPLPTPPLLGPVFLDLPIFWCKSANVGPLNNSECLCFRVSMFAPKPFYCVRILSHAACFTFFVTVDENGAKTIISIMVPRELSQK